MTTVENVDAIIKLIKQCFCYKERMNYSKSVGLLKIERTLYPKLEHNQVNERNEKHVIRIKANKANSEPTEITQNNVKDAIKLHEICIYPIKSCGPYRVDKTWPINRRGLKYDREWMIVRSSGVAMTQKSDTKLCLIQPEINENDNTLSLNFPYAEPIKIPLHRDVNDNRIVSLFCQSKVCGDRIDGIDCGDEVADWLSDVLCTSGLRLIQQNSLDKRMTKNDSNNEQAISLSNQAQFLLINVASVEWLTKKVNNWMEMDDCCEKVLQNTIDRFRANLVIESAVPLEEMDWKSIRIGNLELTTTGPCTRCQMICIDQSTGEKTTEPLQTIAREFNGKMRFGIYLCQTNEILEERTISCDDLVVIEK